MPWRWDSLQYAEGGLIAPADRSAMVRQSVTGLRLQNADPDFATSCLPPSSSSSSLSQTSEADASHFNRAPADHLKALFRGPCPPAIESPQNQSRHEGSTPRKSARGKKKPDQGNCCSRCQTKFFINLKLPCGRVVHLCPACTSDFRTHLGKKISEVCSVHCRAV